MLRDADRHGVGADKSLDGQQVEVRLDSIGQLYIVIYYATVSLVS